MRNSIQIFQWPTKKKKQIFKMHKVQPVRIYHQIEEHMIYINSSEGITSATSVNTKSIIKNTRIFAFKRLKFNTKRE